MVEGDGVSDLNKLQKVIARANNARLPAEGDFHYYNSFKSFKEPVRECLQSIKSILRTLPGAGKEADEALDDKDEAFDFVTALLDDTLESADAAIDTAKRVLKAGNNPAVSQVDSLLGASTVAGEPASAKRHKSSPKDGSSFLAQQSGTIERPQDRFEDGVDNSNSPFVHNFQHVQEWQGVDPEAAPALAAQESKMDAHSQKLNQGSLANPPSAQHPLAALLADLHYSPWQLEAIPPQAPKALEDTPLTLVDTEASLESMVQHLSTAKEVAVDLEHHHYRSFQGFTCLMQLSTRQEDFIVDTLTLRAHLGPVLSRIFSDPKIVKVLHGADKDIQWLQRDFGIYVANMFDTAQASRVLEYPGHGLGYLLQHFCAVKADKKYQLADWRVRPLPQELLLYARMDTHYLLYIHDRLKAELLKQGSRVAPALEVDLPPSTPPGALGVTFERSKQLCLQMYEKELFTDSSYQNMTAQLVCTPEQLAAFAGLYAWRDSTARAEDESTGYVLSRSLLQKLAMQLPTSASKVRSLCNTRSAPLVMKHAAEVAQVIANSKQQAAHFAHQPPNTTAAVAAHTSSASPVAQSGHALSPSSTINGSALLSTSRQAAADSPLQTAATAADTNATIAANAAATSTKMSLPEAAAAAAVPNTAVADVIRQVPESKPQQPMGVSLDSTAAGLQQASGIKPKMLKPIAMAPAASAFGRTQPKHPESTQGTLVPQPSNAKLVVTQFQRPTSPSPAAMTQQAGVTEPAGINQPASSQRPPSISKDTAAQSQLAEEGETSIQAAFVPVATTAIASAAPSLSASMQPSVDKAGVRGQSPSAMASALAKQPQPIPQIRAAAGGLFSAAPPQRTTAGLPDSQGTSAAGAILSKHQLHEPDLAAVNRLRAQFILPFAVAPGEEQLAAAKAGKRQQPEGQEPIGQGTADGPGNEGAAAEGVRAVVDALQAEKPSDSTDAAEPASKKQKGSEEDAWHNQDFLPLPMSESYRLPSRKKLSQPEDPQHRQNMLSHDKPGRWAHDKHAQDDPQDDPDNESAAQPDLRRQPGRVEQALQYAGLDSSDEHGQEDERHEAQHQRKKKRTGSHQDDAKERSGQGRGGIITQQSQGRGQSGDNPFGALVRASNHDGKQNRRSAEVGQVDVATNATDKTVIKPFNYTAARAEVPGLELGLNATAQGNRGRGRGRGRGSRDSAGRGQGRGGKTQDLKPSPAGAFNPYGVTSENWLKAGKRSAVMPRSGNRSKTFAGS